MGASLIENVSAQIPDLFGIILSIYNLVEFSLCFCIMHSTRLVSDFNDYLASPPAAKCTEICGAGTMICLTGFFPFLSPESFLGPSHLLKTHIEIIQPMDKNSYNFNQHALPNAVQASEP